MPFTEWYKFDDFIAGEGMKQASTLFSCHYLNILGEKVFFFLSLSLSFMETLRWCDISGVVFLTQHKLNLVAPTTFIIRCVIPG